MICVLLKTFFQYFLYLRDFQNYQWQTYFYLPSFQIKQAYLASGLAFVSLGSLAFGYSMLVTLASVFVLGWALVFGGIFQTIHAFKVSRWRASSWNCCWQSSTWSSAS